MANNPVDAYIEGKAKEAADRNSKDLRLLDAWKKSPTQANLIPLMHQFDNEVGRIASIQAGGRARIKPESHKAFLRGHMIDAFGTYDVNKARGHEGKVMSLKGHVEGLLRNRGQRYIGTHQNTAYIPEQKAALIMPIKKARETLFDEFGKEPSNKVVANWLNANQGMPGIPSRKRGKFTSRLVGDVDKLQIADVKSGGFESDPGRQNISLERETLSVLHHSLTPAERVVFDYNSKGVRPGQIAKKLGKSNSYVSRQLSSIRGKYGRQLGLGNKAR